MTKPKVKLRKVLALLLTLSMVFSLLPAAASEAPPAEETTAPMADLSQTPSADDPVPTESPSQTPSTDDPIPTESPSQPPAVADPAPTENEPQPAADGTVKIVVSDPKVVWSEEWISYTYPDAGPTTYYTNTAGSTVTVPFTGTGIAVYGKKAFNGPILKAVIDGGESADVDFYGNGDIGNEQEAWSVSGLAKGDHTLTLTVSDEHNEVAKASVAGLYQTEINYFLVTNVDAPIDPDAGFADGAIHDDWTQDPATVKGEGAVNEIKDGKRYLKAGDGNGNGELDLVDNPYPAVFVDKTMSAALAGVSAETPAFLEFTLERVSDHESNFTQFGVYLNYKDPANTLFVGCDAGGWFWHKVVGGGGNYYKGGRVALPGVGQPVTIRLEWTGTSLNKATIDEQPLFPDLPLDFSAAGGNSDSRGTVGFKVGRWANQSTEILVSGVTYTGQAKLEGYAVAGAVTEANSGAPIAGAAVTIAGRTVITGANGKYAFNGSNRIPDGSYKATVTKEGYADGKFDVTVASADLADQDVALVKFPSVSGTVTGENDTPLENALVKLGGKQAVTSASGAFTIPGIPAGTYTLTASADGYQRMEQELVVKSGPDLSGVEVKLTKLEVKTATLSTADMDVVVDMAFPRVIQYKMNGDNKVFYGQTEVLDTLRINGVDVKPAVSVEVIGDYADRLRYIMTVKDEPKHIDATITAELVAVDNTLEFRITDVTYTLPESRTEYPIESIEIPNHSLISVRSTQSGADLAAARLGGSTIRSGDTFLPVDESLNVDALNGQSYMYAFLSNDELSAGISGNSDVGTGAAAGDNYRITLSAQDRGAYKTVGAGSSLWYYDRKISSSDTELGPQAEKNLNSEQTVVGIRKTDNGQHIDEMPYVKVVITADENGDGAIDWQDGAIAARETETIHIPAHSDSIPDLISTRISMNFQSEAANPFLTALDNVKRVALHSDGLGQSILLKGYANEGHDSGHPDYYDIGRRMGGTEDMLTMLEEGQKYGAEFGIHVNASEFYPEAKSFNEEMIRRDGNGGLDYRWNWLDQGIGINGVYDLASGNRMERWDKLYAQVQDKLDYVYVDVWGNYTSGTEDAWQTRKLSNEIISHDWRIVHEWGYANEWDSTFQHWVSDFGYGGYDQKGQLNSAIMRFMLNSYKDSFVPDFPTYGGAANAPLLGGPVMQGFEGWQGDVEYDLFIDTQYNQMMPTKFLQHYDIMKWVDNREAVTIPYGTTSGGFSESQTSRWTPEVQITLQSQDRADTVVVTRGSDEEINETYAYATTEERLEYRSRTITLNGKTILTGASNPGDFTSNAPGGNMKYLLPWYWDINGDTVAAADEKLYHYNVVGGESTWELPDGWTNLANVKVYRLTDQGRTEERTVAVNSGSITLTGIEAETPYVVVKGENGAAAPVVEFTAKGMHLKDVSFNGALTDSWTVTGDAETVRTAHQIPMLKMGGEASVSQVLTDLEAGQKYAIYVGVDNRSDAKAAMTVSDSEGNVLASNYTLRSISRNYVGSYVHRNAHPTQDGASYFQYMYVFFTAPESGDLTLTLSREPGEGNTYFDDVRVVENESSHYTYDDEGGFVSFTQDFENVAQGLFPFVVGPGQGDTDGRTHLSQLHAPYTQAGWDVKKVSDVLGGEWSVKINGLTQISNVIYYTIPQNFHFEPGVTYTVSFDYQMGSEGTYDVVYGSGVYDGNVTAVSLSKAQGTTAKCTFNLIGDESGQTWFGIRSTGTAPDNQGTSGGAATFGGYMDFILDNLSISVSKAQKRELAQTIARGTEMIQADYVGDWDAFQEALAAAQTVMNAQEASQAEVDAATAALERAIASLILSLSGISGAVTDQNGPVSGVTVILEDSSYLPTGKTTITNADGKYSFADISAKDYQLKFLSKNHDVTTVPANGLSGGTVTTVDVSLTARAAVPYENNFNSGDVTMLKSMLGNGGDGKNEAVEAVMYGGSMAAELTFNSSSRNRIVDTGVKMKNGTFEMDVTPMTTNLRCGIVLRGIDTKNDVYTGPFDAPAWGWVSTNAGQESYAEYAVNPTLAIGVTRNVKFSIDGTKITLVVDGVTVIKDADLGAPVDEAGYVGFLSERNPGARYIIDNIRVTPTDAPAADTYTIGGIVTGKNGAPVAGAQVTALQNKAVVANCTTAADGSYATMPLAAGEYTVTVSAFGYGTSSKNVTIIGQNITDCNVSLAEDVTQLKAQLQALYDGNRTLEQGKYSDESWTAFQAALKQAETALKGSSADEMTSAYTALTDAIIALTEEKADLSELRVLYTAYLQYTNSYTESSWAAFQEALQNAAKALSDPAVTQEQVDAAIEALQAAHDGLVYAASPVPSGGSSTKTKVNADGSKTTTVTDRKTGTVTATTTYPDGKEIRSVTTKAGDKAVTVTDKNGGRIAEISIPAVIPTPDTAFTDVAETSWAKESVDFVAGMGLFTGTPGGTFDGLLPMTRGMLASVLHRLSGGLPGDGHGFTDVTDSAWYAAAVDWTAKAGIVTGVSDTQFAPESSLTRETLAVMLYRYAGMLGMETAADQSLLAAFSDSGSTSAWAEDAMAWAVTAGILSGKNGGNLDPAGTATRYEVAAMLERFVNLL